MGYLLLIYEIKIVKPKIESVFSEIFYHSYWFLAKVVKRFFDSFVQFLGLFYKIRTSNIFRIQEIMQDLNDERPVWIGKKSGKCKRVLSENCIMHRV